MPLNEIQPTISKLKKRVSNAIQDRNKAVEIGVNLDKRLENQKIQTGAVRSERRRDEINKILENTNLNSTKKNEFLQKYTTGKSRYKTTKQLREELRGVENKNKNDKNKPKTLQNTFKTPFKKKKNAFINYARKTVGSHGGPFQKGRIGKWKNAINRANLESFNKLKTNFDQKLKLHEEIKKTTFVNKGTKQRLQSIVMQQSGRYNNIKKKFDEAKKTEPPIYNSGSSSNENKPQSFGNPLALPNAKPNPLFSRQEKRLQGREEQKNEEKRKVQARLNAAAARRKVLAEKKQEKAVAAAKEANEKAKAQAKINIERAEKKAGEKAAKAAAKAAKEAGEKAAKEAKEAEEKAAKEAADKARAEKLMRKKVKRDIETNIRLNANTKAALTKRINNGNNINAVKKGLSEVRKQANKERTKAAVMIQKTERGRQNRQKVAKMRANEKEGVARAQSNLKASINQAAGVIRGYKIPNANKQGFINKLKNTKTQINIKIIQGRAKTIHNAAVTNKKMAAKAAAKEVAKAEKEKERQEAEARTKQLKANKQAAEAALNAEKEKARKAIAGYTLYDWQAKRFLKKIKEAKKSDQLRTIQIEAKGIHNKTVKNKAEANRKAKANAAKKAKAEALRKRLKTNLTNTMTKPKNLKRRPVVKK
jgi:hypothetical protein